MYAYVKHLAHDQWPSLVWWVSDTRPNIFQQCSIIPNFFSESSGIFGYFFVKPAFWYLSLCLDIYISSTFRFTIFIAKGIENDTTDYLVLCPWIKMTILIFGLEEQKPKRGIILESRTNASPCRAEWIWRIPSTSSTLSLSYDDHLYHYNISHCAASTSVPPLRISNPCIIVIINTVNHSRWQIGRC